MFAIGKPQLVLTLAAALVFFTNQPDHYVGGEGAGPGHTLVFTGLNLPEFRQEDDADPASAMARVSEQHPAIIALYNSIMAHQIPDSLDWGGPQL